MLAVLAQLPPRDVCAWERCSRGCRRTVAALGDALWKRVLERLREDKARAGMPTDGVTPEGARRGVDAARAAMYDARLRTGEGCWAPHARRARFRGRAEANAARPRDAPPPLPRNASFRASVREEVLDARRRVKARAMALKQAAAQAAADVDDAHARAEEERGLLARTEARLHAAENSARAARTAEGPSAATWKLAATLRATPAADATSTDEEVRRWQALADASRRRVNALVAEEKSARRRMEGRTAAAAAAELAQQKSQF